MIWKGGDGVNRKKGANLVSAILAAAALAALLLLWPRTLDAYREWQTEASATPTPTVYVPSMLLVTPDPAAIPSPTPRLFKLGSKGDDVLQLQRRLAELGYYTGDADGAYGPGTESAVLAFQKQTGLSADGMAGESTLSHIYMKNAPTYVPTPTPAPTPTPNPSVLKRGSSGDQVTKMQKRLIELGYLSGTADGIFGGGTEQALLDFQRQNGLKADGAAAEQTFALLYSSEARRYEAAPTPDPDALPILVNRTHPLDENYVPANLVLLENVLPRSLVKITGSKVQGDAEAVNALKALLEAAVNSGIKGWQISAGYRSYAQQKKIFNREMQSFLDQGFSKSKARSATSQTVADPGCSEHHTGLAFDLTVAGTVFKGTPQQKWLHQNCWDYGFVIRYPEDKEKITGYLAECWHIRYVGIQHSIPMRQSGKCLEEYLGILD